MKKLNKIGIVLIVMIMVISIVGCSGDDKSTENGKTIEEIKESGTLVVGMSADYPPFEFHAMIDGEDTIVGFDVSIAEAIAEELGVELEIKDMDFDGLVAAVKADKVDMAISCITPDEDRAKEVDFTNIYYEATHSVVVKAGEEDNIKNIEDLNGKIIGVQQGSVQSSLAKELIESPAEIREVGKITDLILMLQSDKVDAIIMETPVAQSYADRNDDLECCLFELEDDEGGAAIAVKKGSSELVDELNSILEKLEKDGSLVEFYYNAELLSDNQ